MFDTQQKQIANVKEALYSDGMTSSISTFIANNWQYILAGTLAMSVVGIAAAIATGYITLSVPTVAVTAKQTINFFLIANPFCSADTLLSVYPEKGLGVIAWRILYRVPEGMGYFFAKVLATGYNPEIMRSTGTRLIAAINEGILPADFMMQMEMRIISQTIQPEAIVDIVMAVH